MYISIKENTNRVILPVLEIFSSHEYKFLPPKENTRINIYFVDNFKVLGLQLESN